MATLAEPLRDGSSRATLDELLLAYATGALPEAPALLVATHATLNPAVRRRLRAFEAVGGELLEELEPVAMSGGAKADLLARLDEAPAAASTVRDSADARLPAPLAALLPNRLERLAWRRRLPGLKDWDLPALAGGKARLMWVAGRTAIPQHTHRGLELTLVLEGAYHDGAARYGAGDLQIADEAVDHRPLVTDPAACLCLVVTDAPVRLTGRIGRLFNRLVRY
jgi:putative transcriptional regulator